MHKFSYKSIKNQNDIKNVIKKIFKNKKLKVYLFGSRLTKKNSVYSDLDLAFACDQDISYELSILREVLEESNLVFDVDLVDLSKVSKDFRENVLKNGKLWINLGNG
ncbi:MAG: nucleotidyltransferase family protein [bacterium]